MKIYFKYIAVLLLAASIMISAFIISNSIQKSVQLFQHTQYAEDTQNNIAEKDEIEKHDYLSLYEACVYLRLDESSLLSLLQSGDLDNTYIYIDGTYVFNRSKLVAAMDVVIREIK